MYPLLMKPYYRFGAQTPWGGFAMRDLYQKDAPDSPVGESLEVSAVAGMESVIVNGDMAGISLGEALSRHYEEITGQTEGPFPLLLKLLDARVRLSVQVHPGDQYAMANEGERGKAEAWMVLGAGRGAKIAMGVKDCGRSLADLLEKSEIEDALHWEAVVPGDVFYIPAGMIHALGGDIQCYEIQQSSFLTYRMWDWGRVDREGKRRELHVERALAVARPELRPIKPAGATLLCEGGSRTHYICGEHFELTRLNVCGQMPLCLGRMAMLTPLMPLHLCWDGGEMDVKPMETVLLPARLGRVILTGRLPVVCSALPDREGLAAALGYRAGDVAGLL